MGARRELLPAATYLRNLLVDVPRYSHRWAAVASRATGSPNLDAVSTVLVEYHWRNPDLFRTRLPSGHRSYKDKVRRALNAESLTHETLRLFIDAFDLTDGHASELTELLVSAAQGDIELRAQPSLAPDSNTGERGGLLLPPALGNIANDYLVGREGTVDCVVEHLLRSGSAGCEVVASTGAGTTSVIAAVAARLAEHGVRTSYLPGLDGPKVAFGPLLSETPEFGPIFDSFHASTDIDSVRRSRCWASVLAILDTESTPFVFAVDNERWLDSHTSDLLRFLAQAATSRPFSLLVGGRDLSPTGNAPWRQLVRVDILPLSEVDIREYVGVVFPGTSTHLRRHLASETLAITSGLASDVAELVQGADPETLTIQRRHPSPNSPAELHELLSEVGCQVAAAAAILAPEWSWRRIAQITDLSDSHLATGLEEVAATGLIVEAPKDQYRLVGSIRRSSMTGLVSSAVLGEMHFRAASLAATNEARAWHLDESGGRSSEVERADAHLLAAMESVRAASFREAVSSFRSAELLRPDMFSLEQLIAYAEALDRSGARGDEARAKAMTEAQIRGDESVVLAAALSGLPETEELDGDRGRVGLLRSVRTGRLDRVDRLRHALALSRQLLLSGELNEARQWAASATHESQHIDEKAAAWLALCHTDGWHDAKHRGLRFIECDELEDLNLLARVQQAVIVSLLISGQLLQAEEVLGGLKGVTAELGDPLRTWHAGLLESLIYEEQGLFDAADQVGEATHAHGLLFGIAHAPAARAAQIVRRQWHLGQAGGDEVKHEELGPPSLVASAGFAIVLARSGRLDDGLKAALAVHQSAFGSRFELAVAGLLATLGDRLPQTVRVSIRDCLRGRAGTALIVGAGVGSLGPVEGLLAHVTQSDDERLALWQRAVELADRWNAPLWRIRTRAFLARQTGDPQLLDQASKIAAPIQFRFPEAWWEFEVPSLP